VVQERGPPVADNRGEERGVEAAVGGENGRPGLGRDQAGDGVGAERLRRRIALVQDPKGSK
jgi:hypothetical protein